jgi:Peptidase inhibitor family I36
MSLAEGKCLRGRTPRLLAVLVATAAFASLGALPSVASAEHGCVAAYACGWVDGGYGTPMGKWSENTPNFSVFGQSRCQTGNWNDCVSSVWNEGTSCNVSWYVNSGYGGGEYRNNRGTGSGVLGGWNDEFSSLKWCVY